MEVRVRAAVFVGGADRVDRLPPTSAPEVAFAGRSNVGKSSLIQSLVERRGLVRISSTPGRTRQINVFEVALEGDAVLSFADLPGYGWAQVSKAERKSWGPLVERYVETRPTLRAVVVIVDARRGAADDDVQLVEYLRAVRRTPIVVATKIDKLPKNRRKPRAAEIAEALGERTLAYSSVTGAGRADLWDRLLRTCSPESARSGDDPGPRPTS